MSITLTTQVLEIQDLSQPEKHILTILCFRANQNHEVYSSIKRLSLDCSCSIKTIERSLKTLRDKCYLNYTGKFAPKSNKIPIYRINFYHGLSGGDKSFITDSQGGIEPLPTPSEGIRIDNKIIKDNASFSFNSSKVNPEVQNQSHDKRMREYLEAINERKKIGEKKALS